MSESARPETFADRRRIFAARQRRFIAVIGPCLIAALTILALGAGERLRGLPFSLAPALLIALVSGVVVGVVVLARSAPEERRRTGVPFGPFLAIGGLTAIYAGHAILNAYLHRLG